MVIVVVVKAVSVTSLDPDNYGLTDCNPFTTYTHMCMKLLIPLGVNDNKSSSEPDHNFASPGCNDQAWDISSCRAAE